MAEEEQDKLIVDMQGELLQFEEFQLTFGDVLAAKQKAQASNVQGKDYEYRHKMLWLLNRILKKNDIDKDISWVKDVPVDEMKPLLDKIEEHNDGVEKN